MGSGNTDGHSGPSVKQRDRSKTTFVPLNFSFPYLKDKVEYLCDQLLKHLSVQTLSENRMEMENIIWITNSCGLQCALQCGVTRWADCTLGRAAAGSEI